jgi:hypothetical protein
MANRMSRSILLAAFLSLSAVASADQAQEWLRMLENPRYSSQRLKPGNELIKYSNYDLSTLLVPRTPFLGYIGNDYRRLNMYFTSVSKSSNEGNLYLVSGISLVGKNKCEFRGSIKIEQVREYETLHYGVDDTYKDVGIKAQGALIGRYKFEETPSQNHSGVFEGIITSFWAVDRNGIIHPDRIELFSDNYRNNQYVGTWTEYGKNNGIVANWGEARIPFSSKLDIGAGEFGPDPKYRDKGWGDLYLP